MTAPSYEISEGDNARQDPVRVVMMQEDHRPMVDLHDDELVMTFPHLVVRELLALFVLSIIIVLWALAFDAPLEELANPLKTPNPAKAPWYFLGLQELLHYYPPLISGVILPGLVLFALIVVPYVEINLKRDPFWETNRSSKILGVLAATAAVTVTFYFTGAHPVWPLIGPTWFVGALMLLPGVLGTEGRWLHWLGTRSLPFWIFVWFLVAAFVMTIIGVFFRGPGWAFTIPWIDGIYY